jgi:hypothetical protein
MRTNVSIAAGAAIIAFSLASPVQVQAWTTNAPYEAERTCCYLQHGPFYPESGRVAPAPIPLYRHEHESPFEDRTTECVTQDLGDLLVTQCD